MDFFKGGLNGPFSSHLTWGKLKRIISRRPELPVKTDKLCWPSFKHCHRFTSAASGLARVSRRSLDWLYALLLLLPNVAILSSFLSKIRRIWASFCLGFHHSGIWSWSTYSNGENYCKLCCMLQQAMSVRLHIDFNSSLWSRRSYRKWSRCRHCATLYGTVSASCLFARSPLLLALCCLSPLSLGRWGQLHCFVVVNARNIQLSIASRIAVYYRLR